MPTRVVICTLGETWPMGQVLRGPLQFTNPVPYYGKWKDRRHGEAPLALLDMAQEGDEFVVYTDLHVPEGTFISCGIRAEIRRDIDDVDMVDSTMLALFLAPKVL